MLVGGYTFVAAGYTVTYQGGGTIGKKVPFELGASLADEFEEKDQIRGD